MDNFDFCMLLLGYGLSLTYLLTLKKNKLTKFDHIVFLLNFIVFSIIILNIMFPPIKRSGRPMPKDKACFSNQRELLKGLESFYKTLPEKMDVDELIEVEKNILIPRKYISYPITKKHIECFYIIKNSELFCVKHGSWNDKSRYFTNGEHLDLYEDYFDLLRKRQDEEQKEYLLERQKFEKKKRYCIGALFLLVLSSIIAPYFIFFK